MFVVIENTPGYLPEDDDPAPFDDVDDAREYLKAAVECYCDFVLDGSGVEPTVSWDRELTEAYVSNPSREHDLGRVFAIETCDAGD